MLAVDLNQKMQTFLWCTSSALANHRQIQPDEGAGVVQSSATHMYFLSDNINI